MNNKVLIGTLAGCTIVIAVLLMFLLTGKDKPEKTGNFSQQRANILKIIERYQELGEYERALNQIEELLKYDITDKEALRLQEVVIKARREKEAIKDSERLEREREDKERLLHSVSTAIERKDEKPVIIRRTSQANENDKSIDPKEVEKNKRVEQFISDGIDDYNNQNFIRAKDNLLKALQLSPDNAEANAALASVLFDENPDDRKNIEEAVSRAQRALKKDSNSELARTTLAKIYSMRGMRDQAIEEYNQAVKINPNNYDAFYNLGRLYFMNNDFAKAENSFNSAINLKKDFVNGYFFLGLTQYRLNKKEQSIQSYRNAINLDPNFFEAYVNLAEIYRLDGNFRNALTFYNQAAKINNRYNIQRRIGQIHESLNQSDSAVDSYLMSISLNPLSSDQDKRIAIECYVSIANIKNIQSKFKEAMDYVKKGLEIDENNANLHFMGGFSSDKLNMINEAETFYKNAIKSNPGYTQAYVNLSSIYNSTNRFDESIKLLNESLNYEKNNYKIYHNLGDAQQKTGNFQNAIDSYKKAISINSQEAVIYFNMGLCLKSINSHDTAIIILKRAIELDRNLYNAYYELGESYFIIQSYNESKEVFTNLLKIKPDFDQIDKISNMLSVING